MSYFNYFPQIQYYFNDYPANKITATNLIRRFKPLEKILRNARLYDSYHIQDGERPDVVSEKFYRTPYYDWLVLMFNEYFDPYFEWPLSYNQFRLYLEKQYGSYENSTQLVHHYEWIIQPMSQLYDGTNIQERILWVDHLTYLSLIEEERRIVYVYDYEVKINERRRTIKILDPSYIPQVENEAATVL